LQGICNEGPKDSLRFKSNDTAAVSKSEKGEVALIRGTGSEEGEG
jgi:hypothetical protein